MKKFFVIYLKNELVPSEIIFICFNKAPIHQAIEQNNLELIRILTSRQDFDMNEKITIFHILIYNLNNRSSNELITILLFK